MLFSTKAEYGVRLMVELGRRAGDGAPQAAEPVALAAVAEAEMLPLSYLEHLVAKLRQAGLVTSVRGAHGGYRLARSPQEISLAQILQAVEGPFNFVECASDAQDDGGPAIEAPAANGDGDCCGLSPLCVSRGPLLILHARIAKLLDELSLADLCGLERGGMARLAADMFPSRSASDEPAGNNGCASTNPSPAQSES